MTPGGLLYHNKRMYALIEYVDSSEETPTTVCELTLEGLVIEGEMYPNATPTRFIPWYRIKELREARR